MIQPCSETEHPWGPWTMSPYWESRWCSRCHVCQTRSPGATIAEDGNILELNLYIR